MNLSHEEVQDRYSMSYENYLGVHFNTYKDGKCDIDLEVTKEHLNIGGTTHGGVINGMLDIALSGAVTSTVSQPDHIVVTMQMNVNFLRAGQLGDKLTATGEVIKLGSTIAYVEGSITNQDGKLLARASGDWFIKKPR